MGYRLNIIKKSFNKANNISRSSTRHRIPVRSPENSTKYFALLIARVQLSHMRRMTAARQKVLIDVGRFGV
jgi:hypothetical protein